MSLILRQPLASDYKSLASWVPDALASRSWAGPKISFPFSAAELPGLLTVAGSRSYFLAEGNSSPNAFGQHWVIAEGAVHIGRIIVAPRFRRKGVGRILLEQIMGEAVRWTHATSVTLTVYRDNTAAVALYCSLGFLPVESRSNAEVNFMRLVLTSAL